MGDRITKRFNFGTINQNIDSAPNLYLEGSDYKLQVIFDHSFMIENVMVDFLSTLDILARIGGLWAAFKIILAIFLPFMILIFMFSLGDIIIRKAQQKLRIMQLKELQKNFGKIKESIKKQMIQFRGDQNKVN